LLTQLDVQENPLFFSAEFDELATGIISYGKQKSKTYSKQKHYTHVNENVNVKCNQQKERQLVLDVESR
jgi:hypothetical protein